LIDKGFCAILGLERTFVTRRTPATRRLWLPLLPIWISSLVLLVLVAVYEPIPSLLAAVALLGAGIGVLQGTLLALDLGKVRLYRQRADRLEAVFEVIRKAGSSLELQDVLEAITRLTVEVTGVRGCSVKLWDTNSGTMRVRAMAGIARQEADLSVDVAQNISHRSLMEGRPVLVEEDLVKDFPEVDDQTESLICVPLRHERRVLGALCVYGDRGGNLSQEMISFFSILGDLVTLSIANAAVYENLKRVDEAKTWFLLKASHELRSPLGAIQSMARTLSEGLLGSLSEEQRRVVERIESRAGALGGSVGDLLLLTRGRAVLSTSELEEISFCSLLEENLQTYGSMAEEKGVRLDISCPADRGPGVYGRREGIQSIVANLLSNAIKYTPAGGTVSVSAADSGEHLLFEVRDTGIGIPKAEQDKLFSEFFRASNARRLAATGTGLGLAIVKTTVEQHGGRIEVDSREGEGTTVRVYLQRVGK
jgi:signal transduction histidine kinase